MIPDLFDRWRLLLNSHSSVVGLTAETIAYITNTYGYTALETLVNYLISNPLIVPYVNEDNDIICSLIDCGYKRWLVGNGVSYILTSFIPNNDSSFVLEAKLNTMPPSGYNVGMLGQFTTNARFLLNHEGGGHFGVGYGDTYARNILNTDLESHIWKLDKNYLYIDNGIRYIYNQQVFVAGLPIRIFGQSQAGTEVACADMSATMAYLYQDNVEVLHLIPFILGESRDAGQCYPNIAQNAGSKGMIDLISGIFYIDASGSNSFDISIVATT